MTQDAATDEPLTDEERRIFDWLQRQIAEAELQQELFARNKNWSAADYHKIRAEAWVLALNAGRRRDGSM